MKSTASPSKPETRMIPMEHIIPHPLNSNVMGEEMMRKLEANITKTGKYPALITRQMDGDIVQTLDGHHRYLALVHLGYKEMKCEVWEDIDDDTAAMFVATLNTIKGQQDSEKRRVLLTDLVSRTPVPDLQLLLPESGKQLASLMDLSGGPLPGSGDNESEDEFVVLRVSMFKSQHAVVKTAIARMQKQVQGEASRCNEATALEYICAEYLNGAPLDTGEEARA